MGQFNIEIKVLNNIKKMNAEFIKKRIIHSDHKIGFTLVMQRWFDIQKCVVCHINRLKGGKWYISHSMQKRHL